MPFIIFSQSGISFDANGRKITFAQAVEYVGKKPEVTGAYVELIEREKVDALFRNIIDQLSMGGGLTEDECRRILRTLRSKYSQLSL